MIYVTHAYIKTVAHQIFVVLKGPTCTFCDHYDKEIKI